MSKFVQGNPELDFFDQNPELRYFPVIQQLLKSVGPEVSSKIMWAIYLTEDPESKYYAMDKDDRRNVIAENYLKIPDFSWEEYDYIISEYPNIAMTQTKKWYKVLIDKMDEQIINIRDMELETKEDFEKFMSFYTKIKVMFDGVNVVEAKHLQEKAKIVETRGQQQSGHFGKVRQ